MVKTQDVELRGGVFESSAFESLWLCRLNLKPSHPDGVHSFGGSPTASPSALVSCSHVWQRRALLVGQH